MNIDELCRDMLAASESITPLPWRVDDARRLVLSTAGKRVISEIEMADGGSKKIGADESYIVAACNAAPALARECQRLQEELAELKQKNWDLQIELDSVTGKLNPFLKEAALEQEPRQ